VLSAERPALRVVRATERELEAHDARLAAIDAASNQTCVWRALAATD
jgi:DNA polymerase-3 subunit epsilon